MSDKQSPETSIYLGLIFLVTALALGAAKLHLFADETGRSQWWALFLLVPAGTLAMRARRRWREGQKRRSRHLTRAALFILPVMAALLYPRLWSVIYIPLLLIMGLEMILWAWLNRGTKSE